MLTEDDAFDVFGESSERGDLISITLYPSELEGQTRKIISVPFVVTVTVSKPKTIKFRLAKLAAKKPRAGASKPAKAARSKVEDTPYHKLNEAERRAAFLKAR